MRKYRTKTPLQTWAWNRFRFKGAVTASRALLRDFINQEDMSEAETVFINEIITSLDKIMKIWDQSHQGTRRHRDESKKA